MRAGTKAERDATAVFGNFIKEKCDSGGRGDVLKMLLSACGVVYGADYHGGKVPHGVVHMDQLFELLAPEDLRPGQTELDYSKKKSGAHMLGGHVPDDKAVDRIFTKLDADGQPAKRWLTHLLECEHPDNSTWLKSAQAARVRLRTHAKKNSEAIIDLLEGGHVLSDKELKALETPSEDGEVVLAAKKAEAAAKAADKDRDKKPDPPMAKKRKAAAAARSVSGDENDDDAFVDAAPAKKTKTKKAKAEDGIVARGRSASSLFTSLLSQAAKGGLLTLDAYDEAVSFYAARKEIAETLATSALEASVAYANTTATEHLMAMMRKDARNIGERRLTEALSALPLAGAGAMDGGAGPAGPHIEDDPFMTGLRALQHE